VTNPDTKTAGWWSGYLATAANAVNRAVDRRFDVRDMAQMALHIHDLTDVEIIIGPGAPPREGPLQ
jgi:hypothetical protein